MDALIVFLTEFLAPMIGQIVFDLIIAIFPSKREEAYKITCFLLIVFSFILGAVSGFFYPPVLLKWPLLLLVNLIATPFILASITMKLSKLLKKRNLSLLRIDSYWFVYFTIVLFMLGRLSVVIYK